MSNQSIIEGAATERPSSDGIRLAGAGPGAGPGHGRSRTRLRIIGIVAVPLAFGAAGLSLAQSDATPAAPTSIGPLTTSSQIAMKGDVTEIFGNKFIVQDGTGRALVETGKRGEDGTLVKAGETVTVQGRFERGFLHASVITHQDGSQVRLGPAARPAPGGPGGLGWIKDKVGLGPKLDVPAMTATAERAGYTDVRVTGRGPRHIEVAAKAADGRERILHVDVDGRIRER